MNLVKTDGKEVCVSFWTHDQDVLFELRKLLMRNAIRFEWIERPSTGFKTKE